MVTFAEQNLYMDLDADQHNAAYSPASRLCIVASAGSGKTRVLVKRIEYLIKSEKCLPEQIVAITFTRKAGFELANRIAKIFGDTSRERPIVGTLHAFALNELKNFHDDNSTKIRNLVENSVEILKKLEVKDQTKILRIISWCKTRFIDENKIDNESFRKILKNVHINGTSISLESFLESSRKYKKYLKDNGLMDHDDLLIEYHNRLKNENFLNTRRYLYRHLLVDEFQDTTPLHMRIYQMLVGGNGSITVVGDPNQSIFSFAGSSDVYLNNFSDFFPGSQVVFLNKNYRSTKANVEVALSVIENEEYKVEAIRPSNVLPKVHVFSDENEEAKSVLNLISSTHAKGVALNEIAVLVRTNSQKQLFINAANKLGIKYHVGRHEFKSEFEKEIWQQITTLRKKRKWKSIYDALDDINSLDKSTGSELSEEQANVHLNLRKAAKEYISLFPYDKHGDVNGFFEYIREKLDSSNSHSAGFSLLTFHQAKGLEFNTVIVAGFEKGLVPLYNDRIRIKEEARLAYVAMSRALDELHITRACVRTRHGQILVCKESPFLKDINQHISQLDIRNDLFSTQEAIKRIEDIRAKYLEKNTENKS
ncbi:MAG: ATP-dependent helicase [Acidimicrobiia bacterium]